MNINTLIEQLKLNEHKVKIIFPEGESIMIQNVAQKLVSENLANPILVFETKQAQMQANLTNIETICVQDYDLDKLANQFFELRKGKVESVEKAKEIISKTNYFATMLLNNDVVEGYLGGITYSTGATILPGLQIIKTKPGFNIISSTMILEKENDIKYFSDIAINIDPNPTQLSEITTQCAQLVKSFGDEVSLAILSFSTKGSAKHALVDKVVETGQILDKQNLDFKYDYELQFDAAMDEQVRTKKAPNSKLTSQANTFIFPDLNSGNIGYKIAQRLGNYNAIGPIITGFKKPINDLSRGANEEEIFKMAIITAIQILNSK